MEAIFDDAIKRLNLSCRVTCCLWIDVNDVAVARIELHVGALRLIEALREQAGGNQQNKRERRLQNYEGALQR